VALRWNRAEAEDSVAKMEAERRRTIIQESDPRPTIRGGHWQCNACRYRTDELRFALKHAGCPEGWLFDHILYEMRAPEGPGKAPTKTGRRIRMGRQDRPLVERKITRRAHG
jgi:hypothetical protein